MDATGESRKFSSGTLISVALGLLAVGCSLALGYGFTVDDALISTRVAHHLSLGAGYRFNLDGMVADSVTPLGWAHLLSVLPGHDSWAKLQAARWLGALCTLGVGVQLGWMLRPRSELEPGLESGLGSGPNSGLGSRSYWLYLPLAVCLPVGAWGQSGMETPLVMLLVCSALWALSLARSHSTWWALGCATVAAAWRPELIPWTFVLALLLPSSSLPQKLAHIGLGLSAPLLVAALRLSIFGSAAPLAIYAKPADSSLGLSYVLSGLVLTGLPMLCASLRSWTKTSRTVVAVGAACLAELAALVAAGGDWMALFRLFVPLLPACVWLGHQLAQTESRSWPLYARVIFSCIPCGLLTYSHLDSARSVIDNRQQAIRLSEPHLLGAQQIGTIDVGWVGASTPGSLVDFAGATDERFAYLPGSHTSKRLPNDLFQRFEVDALVIMLAPGVTEQEAMNGDWRRLQFARPAERRLPHLASASAFEPVAVIPFGQSRAGFQYNYLLLRRSSALAHSSTKKHSSTKE